MKISTKSSDRPICPSLLGALCVLGASLLFSSGLRADVSLPPIFSEHAVLQKAAQVPVWGKASPGEKVTVTLGPAMAECAAGADGKWKVSLDLSASPAGPFELIVKGHNEIRVLDVLVGEVWVCSGQSNMEFALQAMTTDTTEIPKSTNSRLRQFAVESVDTGLAPEESRGKWESASPQTSGRFSAVGYFFGKTLQQELDVPIGLIRSARGASPCEAWMSREAFEKDPELLAGANQSVEAVRTYESRLKAYVAALGEWEIRHQRADRPDPTLPAGGEWKPVSIPGPVAGPGVVWLRRTVSLPAEQAGKPLTLSFRSMQGIDQVYWNGTKVGGSTVEQSLAGGRRNATVPAGLVREGEATVMVRLFSSTGKTAIDGRGVAGTIPLDGQWEFLAEPLPDPAPLLGDLLPSPGAKPQAIHTATYLFNGQIKPLMPYAIRGVIWYQGEANHARGFQYRRAFPLMITDWREQWGQGNFPFYFCQLANYKAKKTSPGDDAIAELRESQALALSLPNTGQAILIDVGEEADIHPQNKKDVGARLARLALARDYGKAGVEDSGPVYESAKIEGSRIRVTFTHGPLVAKPLPATYPLKSTAPESAPLVLNRPGSELQGFAICGEDKKWVWADAQIDGLSVLVSSPEVSAPVAVRYAWANNPTCNLTNSEGLPAGPFRTDDFPLLTRDKKFGEE